MGQNAGRLTNQGALNAKSMIRVRAPKKMVTIGTNPDGTPIQVPERKWKKNRQAFTSSRLCGDYCMNCKGTIGMNEKGIVVMNGRRVHADC